MKILVSVYISMYIINAAIPMALLVAHLTECPQSIIINSLFKGKKKKKVIINSHKMTGLWRSRYICG